MSPIPTTQKKKENEQNKRSYDGLYIKTYNTNRNNNYIKRLL